MVPSVDITPHGDPSGGGGGGGASLIFSSNVGSGPTSTVHPEKYQDLQAPQKNILHTPQKVFIHLKTILNFKPKQMTQAYVCMKISEYTPPPGTETLIR